MEVETNIRIVRPGRGLYVAVRKARVEGTQQPRPELLQKVCMRLQLAYHLAAVPLPGPEAALAVATTRPVPEIHLKDEEWELTATDAGSIPRLTMEGPEEAARMAALLERALHVEMARGARRWSYDSPRHWYEWAPLRESDAEVAAHRRVTFTGVVVEGEGIGLAADVQTAFFTEQSLAWFFDPQVSAAERQRWRQLFDRLAQRHQGEGTLVYQNGRSHVKCYFADAPAGMTCATTGVVRAHGQSYPSLLDYYRAVFPKMMVDADTPAVLMHFEGLSGSQPVAATRVRLRLFNEVLHRRLQRLTIMSPGQRRDAVEAFWREVGPRPFGHVAPGLQTGFWRPGPSRTFVAAAPALFFGKGRVLHPPAPGCRPEVRQSYFGRRLDLLRDGGCWRLPPTVCRTVDCAFPSGVVEEAAGQFAADVCARLKDWTGKAFTFHKVPYEDVSDSVERLRNIRAEGAVLYVLNADPSAYHEVALRLPERRIKRVTEGVLQEKYRGLREGLPDRRGSGLCLRTGRQEWETFVTLNALELLDKLDGAPFIPACGLYEAQLVIDVGRDRRHFALSLLVNRAGRNGQRQFEIQTEVFVKSDSKFESINGLMLETEIIRLIQKVLSPIGRSGTGAGIMIPLASLLILRDGRLDRDEPAALARVIPRMEKMGLLAPAARVDVALVFKDSLKQFRLWQVDEKGNATNVPESTVVEVTPSLVLLANTGQAPCAAARPSRWSCARPARAAAICVMWRSNATPGRS